MAVNPEAIEAAILALTAEAGPAKSISPTDVARGLEPENWRPLMGPIRKAAARLSTAGRIDILRKGKTIAPEAIHGVIRLRQSSEPEPEGAE
ncbi:MAG: Zinc finger protein [Rubritepida sp.]|nr:Zinc finger protein [Rubritepida sp.]